VYQKDLFLVRRVMIHHTVQSEIVPGVEQKKVGIGIIEPGHVEERLSKPARNEGSARLGLRFNRERGGKLRRDDRKIVRLKIPRTVT